MTTFLMILLGLLGLFVIILTISAFFGADSKEYMEQTELYKQYYMQNAAPTSKNYINSVATGNGRSGSYYASTYNSTPIDNDFTDLMKKIDEAQVRIKSLEETLSEHILLGSHHENKEAGELTNESL